ncbi:MAG: peptidase M20 [Gemmatales bacterium]|nr:MAG: peptidase M20 [Gemmatales bacterium]
MSSHSLVHEARAIKDWIVDIRRRLHRRPELMYEEIETNRLVCQTLDELGIRYRSPIAETGVLATLGKSDGPCVALRADMDALPIHEEADVPFRSEIAGKMHACGHDCHTAMLLGAARLLKQRETSLPGTVKLLFQPAEEGGAGGNRMCQEGALDNPRVQRIFGLHVWPWALTGSVTARAGTFLAATSTIEIKVHGVGGHAAVPQLCVDPVATAAKIVVELQTIISREWDPLRPGVISLTAIHAGQAHNVIPESAEIRGTIRSLTFEELRFLQGRVREIAEHIAKANRCEATVDFPGHDYPPTVNDAHCWKVAKNLAEELLGGDRVHESPPIMGGEDFAYYLQQVPGCFVGLGVRNEKIGATYNVHHPRFKVDEDALPIGSALHVAFAVRSLAELNQ